MTSDAILSPALSRPKIHRRPSLPPAPQKVPMPFNMGSGMVFLVGLVLLAVVANLMFGSSSEETQVANVPVAEEAEVIAPREMALAGALEEKSPGNVIVIKGEDAAIVGQMAKIPTRNEQITEIKAVSNIDKNAGRELLSIINKY